jgi:bifunctional DNA-binding transcriptional regulator/antitoxin component of YhaV-PrlF toxin-antitoxin module
MPRTIFVKIYQSKGNSDTMAVVIPKELRKTLKLKEGVTLKAKVDDKNGLLIYSKKST